MKTRFLSMLLAAVMVIGIMPVSALEEQTVYTGVELRVQAVSPEIAVGEAVVTLRAAADQYAQAYVSDHKLELEYDWYYMYYDLNDIPEAEREDYAPYEYGDTCPYIKPVTDLIEKFDADRLYMCIATITTVGNSSFAEDCEIYPDDHGVFYASTDSMILNVVVDPEPVQAYITELEISVSADGTVTLPEAPEGCTYVYRTDDGSDYPGMPVDPVGKAVGTVSANLEDFMNRMYAGMNMGNQPHITVLMVDEYDWVMNKAFSVLAYGEYTVPMEYPIIYADTLKFGADITVTDFSAYPIGSYLGNLAHVSFDGWFLDAEGTVPAETEQDAYAVFTIQGKDLFEEDIPAENFALSCKNEYYSGSLLMTAEEPDTYRISFFIDDSRITISLKTVGEPGGEISFVNAPEETEITMKQLESGEYHNVDILITVYPGYYVREIRVNGEPYDDAKNPFGPGRSHQIMDHENYMAGIPSFSTDMDTVIEIEFGLADIITIEYGDNIPVYTGRYADEYSWHISGQYYVGENWTTVLCYSEAIRDPEYSQHLFALNTKPDGSGYGATITGRYNNFRWEPPQEYNNGVRDEITLYAIMECDAHVVYGAVDDAWIYYDALEATCQQAGNLAYRHCPNCDMYQTLNEKGAYEFTPYPYILQGVTDHDYSVYTDNSDGTHTVQCATCDDHYTENHTLGDDGCVCGYGAAALGDVNDDGEVDVMDANLVISYYYGNVELNDTQKRVADVNGDGEMDVMDANLIVSYYYGNIDNFPAAG